MSKSNRKQAASASKRQPDQYVSEADFAKKFVEQKAIDVRDWCLKVLRDGHRFTDVRPSFSAPNPEEPSTVFRMTFEVLMPTAHAEHIMDSLADDDFHHRYDEHLERVEEQRRRRASKA
ncbi:hypothetical protein JQK88_07375 [Mesorhizobium caraganae]|uniref:hypothetical protein n=1 Tax=Mesorhizobium caraganae TaxID=483206 RepID=UPI00193A0CC5|nr:hypothetical protein [Mesorhizobium caraganae]MBM2711071.1 hypothetical protein [Mesorhizobium caraganae]